MKLSIAGSDRTGDTGADIARAARDMARHKDAPILPAAEDQSALWLRSAGTEAVFLDRLARLMWDRTGAGTLDFHIRRRPGPAGICMAALKRVLWRLLRYQQDRLVFQQNMINAQLTLALEFIREEYSGRIAELESKVEQLERRVDPPCNAG